MHEVRIELTNAATLNTLAAPVPGAGMGALPAGMGGAGAGIYLIVNVNHNNRYAGISTNIPTRFNGRMAVINEMGFAGGDLANIWGWWGRVTTRRFVPPVNFAPALPTHIAGLPLNQRYALPVVGVANTPCPAPPPLAVIAAGPVMTAARTQVEAPIKIGIAAYQAYAAAAAAGAVNAVTFAANWPAWTGAAGIGLPLGLAAAVAGQASAQAASQAAVTWAGAPLLSAVSTALAVQTAVAGGPFVFGDEGALVNSHYAAGPAGPAALPAWAPPTAPMVRNPVGGGGPVTTLTYTPPGAGVLDLEAVFIRFVLLHLGAGGSVTNGAKTGPLAWPGGGEPICVTWDSVAGGGVLPPFTHSVMWWPNRVF